MRVLTVIHDPVEAQRAASALTLDPDIEVVEVASLKEATAVLEEHPVEVLVVDADLQPEGGFSWVYKLRQHALMLGVASPPAIVLVSREQDRFLTSWSGAEAMVSKPVDGFVLRRRVAELADPAPAV